MGGMSLAGRTNFRRDLGNYRPGSLTAIQSDRHSGKKAENLIDKHINIWATIGTKMLVGGAHDTNALKEQVSQWTRKSLLIYTSWFS